jgi:3-phosphoshikimate 1-carboxyvinyltransferase
MRFEPAQSLRGELTPPPDKSISHRAVLIGAMSEGSVTVRNHLRAQDTASTVAAARTLGAGIEEMEKEAESNTQRPAAGGELRIRGAGLRGARSSADRIDVGNAGTLLRLLPGWLAGQPSGHWTLDGDDSIRRRPVDRVVEPLTAMGARLGCRDGRLPPLTVEGSPLRGIRYRLPVASAQVKSCLLLAGLLAEGETTVVEDLPSRDHTERMLRQAGVEVKLQAGAVSVAGVDRLALESVDVPGDFSSAAFHLVAAVLVADSELVLRDVGVNPTRTGLLAVMERMGAAVERRNERTHGGEPVAELAVRSARLSATTVDAGEVPLMIDELPLVALLGAFAEGVTRVRGASELHHKESDRIATVVEGMRALGATIEATEDGFEVDGAARLPGGTIDSHGDHRLAMLGAVAGLCSSGGVEVRGFEAAYVSYPGFAADISRLKA